MLMEKNGSGINIPDPPHCLHIRLLGQYTRNLIPGTPVVFIIYFFKGIVPLPKHRIDFSDSLAEGGSIAPKDDWTICTR